MSDYTEFAGIEAEIYAQNIVYALKDLVVTALQNGFSKTSYLVQDHVKYIKRIQSAKSPMGYIKYVAKKLFPEGDPKGEARMTKLKEKYKGKDTLIQKFEAVYKLYQNIPEFGPPKRAISADEAEEVLAELLA